MKFSVNVDSGTKNIILTCAGGLDHCLEAGIFVKDFLSVHSQANYWKNWVTVQGNELTIYKLSAT